MKNIGTLDRLLRVFIAEICIIIGFFWASTDWQIFLYLAAAVMIFEAATASSGIYRMLGWNTCERVKRGNKNMIRAVIAGMIIFGIVASYASAVLTKDTLSKDIAGMRGPYSLTLDYTGKGWNKESSESYRNLTASLAAFNNKYSKYRPLAAKFDGGFSGDMQNLSAIIGTSGDYIKAGNLTQAHGKLAEAEPIFEKMMSRNNLS